MAIAVPITGEPVSAAWGASVANALNAKPFAVTQLGNGQANSTGAIITCCTLVVPAQSVAGMLVVTGDLRLDSSVAGDQCEVHVKNNGVSTGRRFYIGAAFYYFSLTRALPTVAGVANTLILTAQRLTGTSNLSVFTEPADVNRLTAVWLPT